MARAPKPAPVTRGTKDRGRHLCACGRWGAFGDGPVWRCFDCWLASEHGQTVSVWPKLMEGLDGDAG